MYEANFGLQEKPFALRPDPHFMFKSHSHRKALTTLEYGFQSHAGFIVVSGPIGSGKTTLVRKLLSRHRDELTVGLVSNTQVDSFEELLRWILLGFDLEYRDKDKVELFHTLTDFLVEECAVGRQVILIIDEAQHLEDKVLEQLRMLSNVNADKDDLLQIILIGQPELLDKLKQPQLRQLTQRITVECHLQTLDLEETKSYIRHRIATAGGSEELFEDEAYEAIWKYSEGIPRLINLLCETGLVFAFAEQMPKVTKDLIKEAVREKALSLNPYEKG